MIKIRKLLCIIVCVLLMLTMSIGTFAAPSDSTESGEVATSEQVTTCEQVSESGEATSSDELADGEALNVVNGDFDDLSLDGWYFDAYSKDDGSSYEIISDSDGNGCAYMIATSDNDIKLCQQIGVEPNSSYRISARVKTLGIIGGNGANIAVLESSAHSNIVLGDADWTKVEFIGNTNSSQSTITITLRIGGYSAISKGEAWFDDVAVVKLDSKVLDGQPMYMEASGNNQGTTKEEKESKLGLIIAVALAVVALAVLVFFLTSKNVIKTTSVGVATNYVKPTADDILLKKTDTKLHFNKVDRIFLIILVVVYSAIALTNLGTTQAPSTAWVANAASEAAVIEFDGEQEINSIYVFGGIADGGSVRLTADDGSVIATYKQEFGHMYRWHSVSSVSFKTKSVTVTAIDAKVDFKELLFIGAENSHIIGKANEAGQTLVDEPEQIPYEFSSRTGMYFDELYHGRTAYEHYYGLESYENSHPPLGKIFISLGIAIFGMNAFGWRVIGVLFGIGMVPILYCFAKYVFKKSSLAMAATLLFTFDFMHFTQTRIATIDVYGVFFILLMFFFMYKYFTMSFFRDGLKATLVPLGLAGIFFGIGISSKWICFYAGAGLAVMLLVSFIMRFCEYQKYCGSANETYSHAVSGFWKNVILTVLFCCVFFLLIPAIIYSASYLVYPDAISAFKEAGIKGYLGRVWHYQDFMFNYHSKLTATHTYQSTWIQWALDLRPMWYSINYYKDGQVATISAMGNPIVWWLSLAGTIGLIIQIIRGKVKLDAPVIMIFIGILSNLLPWMVISRCAFIYHYFATVPFIILAAIYFIKSVEAEHSWFRYFKWWWCVCAIVLFAVFYPVIAGIRINESYALGLEWFKSWWLVRNADAPTNTGIINGIIINAMIVISCVVCGLLSRDGKFDKLFRKNRGDHNGE